MSGKPVLLRDLARRDVEAAVDYYVRIAGPDIALSFIDALQSAYRAIGDRPALGSPRYAQELVLPGLRSLAVKGFPYLVFYIERDDHIDIWRVLHGRRDIPSRMQEPGA
ncbi:MAG: type II toxin-antitoxin system RelE/ParE family toxin [Hyphomicrobiales bacterium]|nr:type II toxin-antitoxin system RelE/ParE family toxin [Hyphomicrobiales bacterium]MBV9910110.1 type II toxin-antitoxin system RelE/ParE family toxin [Hyphomicrobiales bacterium]